MILKKYFQITTLKHLDVSWRALKIKEKLSESLAQYFKEEFKEIYRINQNIKLQPNRIK